MLTDILNSFNLFSAFKEPTRYTANSSTGIDYIITNFNFDVSLFRVIPNVLSDHTAQCKSSAGSSDSNLCLETNISNYNAFRLIICIQHTIVR